MKKLIPGILLALLAITPLTANDYVYHGSFLWNNIRAVVQQGNFLFCAFHDGIGAINLTHDFNKKKLYSTLEIDGAPRRLHLFDSLLVVETESGEVALVDITNPNNMIHRGSFSPGPELFDLTRMDDYLYAAVEYDGIIRYDISDPANITFKDSSMAGIRVTQLQVYESRLYALDDYNGILIYEPDTTGFGGPVSELLLPQQAVSFTIIGDTVYAGLKPNGYLVGSVADVYNPQFLGQRSSYIRGDQIFGASQGLVFANSINGFELIYDSDTLPHHLFPLTGILGYPEAFNYQGGDYIAYPHDQRGFVVYSIDEPTYIDLEYPDFVYAYPGPITQVKFVNSRLHVVGTYNWYEQYDLSNPDHPVRSGKMINPPYRPVGICTKGDTIFVADLETNTFFPAVDYGFGDPVSVFPFFSVSDDIGRPHIIPSYFGDMDLLYFFKDHIFNGTARNSSIAIPNYIRWSFPTGIDAAVIDGSTMYRVSSKGVMFIYRIEHDFELTELARRNSPHVNQMLKVGLLLYTIGRDLKTYSLVDPLAPEVIHTEGGMGTIYEMQRVGSWLICGAQNGVFIFDVSGGIPQPLFSGGGRATMVAYDDLTLVASDSHSVKIYTLPASDIEDDSPLAEKYDIPRMYGYPNPFNPDITLVMENFGPRTRNVSVNIYDILGRRVRRLPVAVIDAARLEVHWDARDENGHPLPSGIYLFKAESGAQQAVYKAILLK
jgi:hypothetical protein